jgi:hypothetical protein
VSASGTAPFAYQWRNNSTPITGQTNATLVFNSIQHTDGGNYNVAVSNPAGTTLSQFAEVIVRPRLVSVRSLTGAPYMQLTLRGTPGRNYVVEATTNLTSWTTLTNVTISTVPQDQTDQTSDVYPHRTYRLRLTP